ncbi:MAG: hypothetical protein EXQ74_04240 [Thermoleophilia bacterium]|nr:hypothetical protein [Thermoleophilia bacterium]
MTALYAHLIGEVDGSSGGGAALAPALRMSARTESRIILAHIVNSPGIASTGSPVEIIGDDPDTTREWMERTFAPGADGLLFVGDPSTVISDWARILRSTSSSPTPTAGG